MKKYKQTKMDWYKAIIREVNLEVGTEAHHIIEEAIDKINSINLDRAIFPTDSHKTFAKLARNRVARQLRKIQF